MICGITSFVGSTSDVGKVVGTAVGTSESIIDEVRRVGNLKKEHYVGCIEEVEQKELVECG